MSTYRYYTKYREPAPGAIPMQDLRSVECYGSREPIKDLRISAWGHADYSAPLTDKQIEDYELAGPRELL